jgi:hypothetical protein
MPNVGMRVLVLAALSLVSACTQILGIEEAHVDATLESSANGAGTGGKTASGGSMNQTAGSEDPGGHTGHSVAEAGAGGSGSSPAEPGNGGAPPESTLCERYCDAVTTNCKGKYEQYRTFDQCVEVCKRLPPGELENDESNTVSCRVRQAEFAESEPFLYCKSAGPLGAGRCGSNCVSYCSLMQATCSAESTVGNLEPSYFASSQECIEACNALAPDELGPQYYSSSGTAEPSSFVGNNIYCRTYHLASALEQDTPDEHCPHAMGGDPCIAQ